MHGIMDGEAMDGNANIMTFDFALKTGIPLLVNFL